MINDHLYEGRYTPTNAYGKRESHNIYAKTREECKEKLAEMIAEVKAQIKAQIKAEKERLKAEQKAWPNGTDFSVPFVLAMWFQMYAIICINDWIMERCVL